MQDMHVSKTKLVEFGNQIAVEGRAFRAFVDPPHGDAGGEADGGPLRADLLCNRRGNFDGDTGAGRGQSAIFISAGVGRRGDELLDQIIVRATNLDTIAASLN